VDARLADYDDPGSLASALRGVDRLLFVSSPVLDPAVRTRQHVAVLAAAAHLEHIVYTSVHGADHDPAHAATEAVLRERGDGATVLRNGFYTEPFVAAALREAEEEEATISSATASRALATASIADLAEAAARAVVGVPGRQRLELRGPAWTYDELARLLGARVGRPIRHRAVPAEQLGPFGPLHAAAAAGALATETGDLEELLGRRPRGIAEVLAATATPARP
jgi:NAD(P)H dehydrogenase (quinone)